LRPGRTPAALALSQPDTSSLPTHPQAAPPTTAAAAPPATDPLTADVVAGEAKYVLQTYARPADTVFVSGTGCRLTDAGGRTFLDLAAGIAVNALGHSDPRWVAAVTDQAARLCHVSNLYHTEPQV